MKNKELGIYKYNLLWRPNYELNQMMVWMGSAAVTPVLPSLVKMPQFAPYYLAAGFMSMGAYRAAQAYRNHKRIQKLRKWKLDFIDHKQHSKIVKKAKDNLWLGYGFDWETTEAQMAFDLIKADPRNFIDPDPEAMGATWMHGLAEEKPINVPLKHLEGHTLIVGTTGSGKTRLLDLINTAAARREPKEAIIVIDPKGDAELRDGLRKVCEQMGEPERFVFIHPAFPHISARINPLASFTRAPELATRIAQLIETSGSGETFKNFGQMAMTNIFNGMIYAGKRPTLYELKKNIELGPDGLVSEALAAHFDAIKGEGVWKEAATQHVKNYGKVNRHATESESRAGGYVAYYRNDIQNSDPAPDLEGLISMFEHDRLHFAKMVTSLTPILTMLTSGELGKLLSPDGADVDDERPIVSMSELIKRRSVVYIGLDSLSDGIVGSALGSILLADLAAVSGARYNYGIDMDVKINLMMDESSEIVNPPAVQLLNKGRGSGVMITLATQTYADFAHRLGSEAAARQVLANCNNLIALRVLDAETQKYIADGIPKTRLKYVMQVHGASTNSDEPMLFGGNASERLMEEEAPMFAPEWFGTLPNLHYIARISGGRLIKGRLPILQHGVEDRREFEAGHVARLGGNYV